MHCEHEACREAAVETLLQAVEEAKSNSLDEIEKALAVNISVQIAMSVLVGKSPSECTVVGIALAMDCKELLLEYYKSLMTEEKANETLRHNLLRG